MRFTTFAFVLGLSALMSYLVLTVLAVPLELENSNKDRGTYDYNWDENNTWAQS